MRFAVLGDIRANIVGLRRVLEELDSQPERLDAIVCAGDLVGVGPDPNGVIDLLVERGIEAVLGNYDDAVAFDRIGSGRDFADAHAEDVDRAALDWTRSVLTPVNLEYLRSLPRDIRVAPGGRGVAIKRNIQDERANEYRRTFFLRAIMGGAMRAPVSPVKRVLVVHGSTRALNEFVRGDTANSILSTLSRDIQADVLISGHASTSFRRDAHGVTFIGVGPIDGPGVADFAIVNVGSEVSVCFGQVAFDVAAHVESLRRSGLPDEFAREAAAASGAVVPPS